MPDMPAAAAAALADAILALHVGVVVFVVAGLAAILVGGPSGWPPVRHRGFRITHLATIAIVALQAWLGRLCPLTVWEQALRNRAGQATYRESFIQHWLSRLIFFEAPWWSFVAAYTGFAAFVLLLWRGITIAARAPDRFGALLVVGFVVQVALQAVLNVAVVTNTIPNTGISLPFFSSGGTSLMMLLGEMGIVLSVSRGET